MEITSIEILNIRNIIIRLPKEYKTCTHYVKFKLNRGHLNEIFQKNYRFLNYINIYCNRAVRFV